MDKLTLSVDKQVVARAKRYARADQTLARIGVDRSGVWNRSTPTA